jgi:peptide/nickel transport system permease protein
VSFQGRSYKTDEKLTDIIRRQAPYSLAITVPALALSWLLELAIACVVAYYRDSWIDRIGVFLSVLGMCVPFLAYMILGQWIMFQVAPTAAFGLTRPENVYVPVTIAVVAGLGGAVRFYRTVILDETNRDYVRTAKAKGVPLSSILFKHVLKNCMLPILTSVVLSIPFLIMGNLLLERFFGVPGLGDLLISSINDRDVPIMTGLTFLTAIIYTGGLLVTDLLYAVFDPRIRLR